MLTMIDDTFKREILTMIDLYIYKRNADNDWSVHLWLIDCTFIREMLTMIELYIYKRNAHNDWTVHL